MRGTEVKQEEMFSCVTLSERVPEKHPLRRVRQLTDEALATLEPLFQSMYAEHGRPSIPPAQLLRALLLQMFYSVNSERMLMEQMRYNLLYRWFVGLGMDEAVWDASTFSKNRERLLQADVARQFFQAVLGQAHRERLLDDEHFTVDGTLIEAWASENSYQPKPEPRPSGKPGGNSRQRRKLLRDTHASRTDPDARLYRKGMKSGLRLSHMAHAMSENVNGLVVETAVSECSPREERQQGLRMIERVRKWARPRAVAADKGYHERDFVEGLRGMNVEAHVPPFKQSRRSLVDAALYKTELYVKSQKRRKWIERFFAWLKNTAGLRKTRHRGHRKLDWNFTLAAAAYNLVRMTKLIPAN
jgi:transposase